MATNTTSTRDLILSILKRKKQLTVSAIALELDITEMAVRRHLNTLERDGIVETSLLRQAMGRPTHVYHLSHNGEEMFPRDYGTLVIELLKDLQELDGQEKIEQLFIRRMERQQQKYEKRLVSKRFDERIYELAKLYNDQGYMVEVTKEEDGSFTFMEFNCPIAEVAKQFPIICEMEHKLFRKLLNTDNIQCHKCLATGHDSYCQYTIIPE
ncbi:putative transcriptional regulator [Evansella cellulosilytica DSM 2522]|uniref:Putative transcriptional regulator n=1 Tax=Evansella cellulosilytica (strain ATCC 21833 / DSM 2522 / FERM P-1141 / JCM 9156 / N-4) TaxID=649639 RepID=E6U2E4_EVAC2|nr:metalloregulator ArsR/SmtB family transcription factor [Evansella cellulosilytica]ADU31657.1 putative transcriptional regulator [Evansella cellulosilytica DSM 2522]